MGINLWKTSTFILAVALALALALPMMDSADAGRGQPHMKAALTATKTATRQLKKAAHNKAGHRVKALSLLHQAETEIHKGLAAGRR